MSLKLKIDLHTHSAEDVAEIVAGRTDLIPAKKFIDMAVEQKFDAISFTHHGINFNDPHVFQYAKDKGLILIPGVEAFINRMHVLLINFSEKKYILTFDELRKYKNDDMLIIAPHPYYLAGICLGSKLEKNIDLFDAIEYCHYYYGLFNLNRKAVRIAKKYNLPIVGNSDAHHKMQFGGTYSYVYTEERSIPAIISAIKQGRVEYVSNPMSFTDFLYETRWLFEKAPYEFQIRARSLLKSTTSRILRKMLTMIIQAIQFTNLTK